MYTVQLCNQICFHIYVCMCVSPCSLYVCSSLVTPPRTIAFAVDLLLGFVCSSVALFMLYDKTHSGNSFVVMRPCYVSPLK